MNLLRMVIFRGGNHVIFKDVLRAESRSSARKRRMGYLLTSLRGARILQAPEANPLGLD